MKYMVAVDASDHARHAFEATKKMANKETDHIYVLFVAEEVTAVVSGAGGAYVDYSYVVKANERVEQEGKVLLAKYGRELTACGIPHTLLLGKGYPKEVIVNEAEEKKVDVLVMGRRGMGRVARLFLGSVSQHCVENAPCSVLVIKGEETKA
ncbi:Universal stress protein [Balamuthia mandrillaris]